MSGATFTDSGDTITSWGWRGERRLWRIRRRGIEGPIEYLSYEYAPMEALLEFLERVEIYTTGFGRFDVQVGL